MPKHFRSAHDLLLSVKQFLLPSPRANAEEALEKVVAQLYEGRGYFWIGIYLAAGDKVIRQCYRGPVPPWFMSILSATRVWCPASRAGRGASAGCGSSFPMRRC